MIKVRAHTCYLGKTGYSAHSRSFFRELSKHVDLRVRNFTWDDNPDYLNDVDFAIIDTITLSNSDGSSSDYPISHSLPQHSWSDSKDFAPDVDIVLMDMDHFYFYDEYKSKVKIAFTVWESTKLPDDFFNQLLKFDYLWVVTKWHKKMVVEQGYPSDRVYVINEGVDPEFMVDDHQTNKLDEYKDGRFKFLFFGRWDYRKAVPNIIQAFLSAFPNNEAVDLVLSADNPYSIDGMNSTEERLNHYGLNDSRIHVKHFPTRKEYVSYIKSGNVLVTCARSEGWNIPLIEAMAAGTPAIYSNWGGQLEFASGLGNPVKILEEKLASIGSELGFAANTPGMYAEPDYDNLVDVLKDCYVNWDAKKAQAIAEKKSIREKFSWDCAAKEALRVLDITLPTKKYKNTRKEAAVVLSHADDSIKTNLLKRCVHNLKKQGYYVIVSSHIQVCQEVCEASDMVLIDSHNPIIYQSEYGNYKNYPAFFYNLPDVYNLVYPFEFNHGFAALTLIQNGLKTAENRGFDKTHFVNYDYILEDPCLLENHSNLLEKHDLVSYKWDEETSVNSGLFSVKSKIFGNAISSINTKEEFLQDHMKVLLEDILYHFASINGMDIKILDIKSIKTNNHINCILISTFPAQKDAYTNDLGFAFVCNEVGTGKNLLYIKSEVPQTFKITIKDQIYKIDQNLSIIRITKSDIEKGIKIYCSRNNHVFNFDSSSNKADIKIIDHHIINDLNDFLISETLEENCTIKINFKSGPFVEITGDTSDYHQVQFIDKSCNCIIHEELLAPNTWSICHRKYYTDWLIRVNNTRTGIIKDYHIDLKDKKVLIRLDSSSLGDTLAWFPYADEFQKKHNCKLIVSTFKNDFFETQYPNIEFVNHGTIVNNVYAEYSLGWYYIDNNQVNTQLHPSDFKPKPLQATASDILGLEYSQVKAKLSFETPSQPKIKEPYICIAPHSTAQSKYWNNPNGWQELTNYYKSKGYRVIIVSREEDGYMGNKNPLGAESPKNIADTAEAIHWIKHCKMFVGVSSGLSWLAWTLDVPLTIISGFTLPLTEPFDENVIRVFKGGICNGCFNRNRLDAGDWNWCPDQKGTARQFECTKLITSKEVINAIEEFHSNGIAKKTIEVVVQESYDLGMVQNHKEIYEAAEHFKSQGVKNFMEIGTDQGGSFAIWSKLSEDGIRISVDLPYGPYGVDNYDVNKRDEHLKSLGSNVHTIHGSSHEINIKEQVKGLLGETQLDFLFIDGDHTYEGVKKDYEMYKEFVKIGGWIAFHDIKDTEFHRSANCRVDKLWNELVGNKVEFLEESSSFGGIGFIQNI